MALTISLPQGEGKGNISISADLRKEFRGDYIKFAYISDEDKLLLVPGTKEDESSFEIKNYIMKGKFTYGRVVSKDLVAWLKSLGFSGKIQITKTKEDVFITAPINTDIEGGIDMRNIVWFTPDKPQPTVRITPNLSSGSVRVAFNSRFMAKLTADYVKLGFDEDNKAIAIKEIHKFDEEDKEIFKIITTKRSKSGTINLKNMSPWFQENNLTGLFEVDYDEEADAYITGNKINEDESDE